MACALEEVKRVCKPSARVMLVVGRESNVMGIPFYNSAIVEKLATDVVGFQSVLKQERKFKNRFGQDIVEDILHFSVDVISDSSCTALQIATECLQNAREGAIGGKVELLEKALACAPSVAASPLLTADSLQKES